MAAANEALRQIDELSQASMAKITGDLAVLAEASHSNGILWKPDK